MAKYILKQEAIFALTNEANTHSNPVKRAYTRAAAIIEQITADDVQPVKHGRWIWDSNAPYREHGAYKCNNCGCHSDFEENYCYNCGADMRGDPDV